MQFNLSFSPGKDYEIVGHERSAQLSNLTISMASTPLILSLSKDFSFISTLSSSLIFWRWRQA
jgi:hypothetical protein